MGDSHVIHGTLGILLPLARMLWRDLSKGEAFVLGPQVPSMGIEMREGKNPETDTYKGPVVD